MKSVALSNAELKSATLVNVSLENVGGGAGGGTTLAFHALTAQNGQIVMQAKGQGSPTYTRAESSYELDHEGVWRYVPAGVLGYRGARVVTNYLGLSEDFNGWASGWGGAVVGETVIDGVPCTEISVTSTANSGIGRFMTSVLPNSDGDWVVRALLRAKGNNKVVKLGGGNNLGNDQSPDITLDDTWRWYSYGDTAVVGDRMASIRSGSTNEAGNFYMAAFQYEYKPGESNQNPGEYVKTDTSEPASQFFSTTNGNSVDGNGIVTEAPGNPLPEMPMAGFYPAAENVCLESRDFDVTTGAWGHLAPIGATKDSVGIDGQPNTAITLTDSTAGNPFVRQAVMSGHTAGDVIAFRAWIKKGADDGVCPAVGALYNSGSNYTLATINKATGEVGATTNQPTTNPVMGVRSSGEYWEVAISITTINVTVVEIYMAPAVAPTPGGAYTGALTGSATFDNAEAYIGAPLAAVLGTPPIFTAGSAVSVSAPSLLYDSANLNDDIGAYYVEIKQFADNAGLDSLTPGAQWNVINGSTAPAGNPGNSILYYTTLPQWRGFGQRGRVGVAIGAGSMKLATTYDHITANLTRCTVDGVSGEEPSNPSGNFAFNVSGWVHYGAPILMRNLRRYDGPDYDTLKAKIDELMLYPDAFFMTVRTTGVDESFTIPLRAGYNYDARVNWGDGSSSTIKSDSDPNATHTYAAAGDYSIRIEGVFETIYFNNAGDKDKVISVDNLGSVGWTSLEGAFFGCTALTDFNAGTADLSGVVSIREAFINLTGATSFTLSNVNLAACTDVFQAFFGAACAVDLRNITWGAITSFREMFRSFGGASADITGWTGLGSVSNTQSMFWAANNLTVVTGLDALSAAPITNASIMFMQTKVTRTDLDWVGDTSLLTNIRSMFSNVPTITSVDWSGDTFGNLTEVWQAFFQCRNLATIRIPGLVSSATTNIRQLIQETAATGANLDISGWDTSSVSDMYAVFFDCALLDVDISSWNIGAVTDADLLMSGTAFFDTNYDKLLIAWAAQAPNIQSGVPFHAGTARYGQDPDAIAARGVLVNTYGWTITDGGLHPDAPAMLQGLVSYWDLDEASGTRVDSHGTFDLAETNGPIAQTPGQRSGTFAALFDNALSQYLSNGDMTLGPQNSQAGAEFTFWLNRDSTGPNDTVILGAGPVASPGAFMTFTAYLSHTQILSIRNQADTDYTQITTGAGNDINNTWVFCSLSMSGSMARLQVGNTIVTDPIAGYFENTAHPFQLAAHPNLIANLFYKGAIQAVGYWDRLLTTDERTWLASQARLYADLASYTAPAAQDIDGDGLPDTPVDLPGVVAAGGVMVSYDADSINVQLPSGVIVIIPRSDDADAHFGIDG